MKMSVEYPTTAFGRDCVLAVDCEVELPQAGPLDNYGRLIEPNEGLTVTPTAAQVIYWSNLDMEVLLDPPLDANVDDLDWDAIHDKVRETLASRFEDAADSYYRGVIAEQGR